MPGWSNTTGGHRVCDDEIREMLMGLIEGDGQFYGYRKLTYALQQEADLIINKKKVYRLCRELRILRPQRRLNPVAPRRLARNHVVSGSNQLWAMDIKYGDVPSEGFFYVLSIIDVFDRCIVGFHVGRECTAKDVVKTLGTALKGRGVMGVPLILRSDNGPQFRSNLTGKQCREWGLKREFIPFRTPNMNAHIEAFHSILENECMGVTRFETFGDAYRAIRQFIRFYNARRLHSGCGYRSPEAYYLANQSNSAIGKAIAV